MRKTSLAIILAFLGLYLQSHATVWIGYFMLQDEIAKYCENKSNAACSGKCQVQKVEARKNNDTLVQVSIPDVSEFLPKHMSACPFIDAKMLTFQISSEPLFPHGYKSGVFRPPISA
ncbi:MAG: hypothetical protein SNJ55_07335 [Chloroherpetonaceae bacterium]